MLCEHSTLANVPRLLADTLRSDYGMDPAPLLARVGIDSAAFLRPGARVPYRKMFDLWDAAVDETSDPLFGGTRRFLCVGPFMAGDVNIVRRAGTFLPVHRCRLDCCDRYQPATARGFRSAGREISR